MWARKEFYYSPYKPGPANTVSFALWKFLVKRLVPVTPGEQISVSLGLEAPWEHTAEDTGTVGQGQGEAGNNSP